jgi:hypothetical protein
MTLRDEIADVRRGLKEVERAMRPLRERRAASRLVNRLDGDVRRAHEDLDDLDAEAGSVPAQQAADYEPVPVPPRSNDPDYNPECDDEGLSGSRHRTPGAVGSTTIRRGRRRI